MGFEHGRSECLGHRAQSETDHRPRWDEAGRSVAWSFFSQLAQQAHSVVDQTAAVVRVVAEATIQWRGACVLDRVQLESPIKWLCSPEDLAVLEGQRGIVFSGPDALAEAG